MAKFLPAYPDALNGAAGEFPAARETAALLGTSFPLEPAPLDFGLYKLG